MICESNIEKAALRLLTRREHSRSELRRKLMPQTNDTECLERVLDDLTKQGYQSDTRFTEQYIHSRMLRGFGPVRILKELQEKGIQLSVIELYMDDVEHDWDILLEKVRQSKFGSEHPTDFKQQAKQARFLEYRGFPTEWVHKLIWG